MANLLYFYKGTTPELNLLAAADAGARALDWSPEMGTPLFGGMPGYVTETMDVLVDAASIDTLKGHFRNLDRDVRLNADRFHRDPIAYRNVIWLHAQMGNETNVRRALVRAIRGEWLSQQIDTVGYPGGHMAKLRLEVERHSCWENASAVSLGSASAITGWAGRFDYNTEIVGDVGGRIRRMSFRSGDSDPVDRIWVGVRSNHEHSDARDFGNIWEVENGTAGTDCGAAAADATASGGNKRVVSFATTPGWAKRLTIMIVNSNYSATYLYEMTTIALWLFRYKLDVTGTCEVQLRYGWPQLPDDQFVQGPVVEVSNTSWDVAEMGVAQLPSGLLKDEYGFPTQILTAFSQFTVQVWARRTSGTPSLEMDCLSPLPCDEGWLVAKGIGELDGTSKYLWYFHSPDERNMAVVLSNTNSPLSLPEEWGTHHFYVPPSVGGAAGQLSLYAVFARASSSDITDQLSIGTLDYYPRYLNLRGND